MINMGMTQYHRVNTCGIKGKRIPITFLILAATLDQTTIKQKTLITNSHQMAGTGNLAGSAKKLDIYGHTTPFICGSLTGGNRSNRL
jgi:hypothetical protein